MNQAPRWCLIHLSRAAHLSLCAGLWSCRFHSTARSCHFRNGSGVSHHRTCANTSKKSEQSTEHLPCREREAQARGWARGRAGIEQLPRRVHGAAGHLVRRVLGCDPLDRAWQRGSGGAARCVTAQQRSHPAIVGSRPGSRGCKWTARARGGSLTNVCQAEVAGEAQVRRAAVIREPACDGECLVATPRVSRGRLWCAHHARHPATAGSPF
jgi:hypothetical protein